MILFHPLLLAVTHLVSLEYSPSFYPTLTDSRLTVGSNKRNKSVSIPCNSLHRPLRLDRERKLATHSVSLFGMIQLPAPYFPFALLLLDLIQAGPDYALKGFTGVVAAHAYVFASIVSRAQDQGSSPFSDFGH